MSNPLKLLFWLLSLSLFLLKKVRSNTFFPKKSCLKKSWPKHFWSKKFLVQKILGCPKIIKVKKSLIQKIFGTTNFLVQQIFLHQKVKIFGKKLFGLKIFGSKEVFFKINVGPQKLRTQKNWVPKFLSKLGQ